MTTRSRLLGLLVLAALIVPPALVPAPLTMPVQGATPRDWNPTSFWHEPWGASGVHKGIDIFAKRDTPVVASVDGLVLYCGQWGHGGNVVSVLGWRWRVHYFAHLDTISTHPLHWIHTGDPVGTVGTSGNAAGKPPHLHYSIVSLIPRPWHWAWRTQGWKLMFLVNPSPPLGGAT